MIALERGDGELIATLKGIRALHRRVIIPATVLAQVWRGGPQSASLSRLVALSEIEDLDHVQAKVVGVRLGVRGGRDVVDAHVVCCAVANAALIATSDHEDIQTLLAPGERLEVVAV